MRIPKIHIALPVMNEWVNLPKLITAIKAQDYKNYELWVCINQPESWWSDPDKISICEDNQRSIDYFSINNNFPIHIFDKSSQKKGWDSKKYGVGWARKILMDEIALIANPEDIIISLDADTVFNSGYFSSVVKTIQNHPKAVALAVPYYHLLTNNQETDRHILRYEIYMRYYSLNLWRIKCPYNFTALGSAIALPVWAYRKIKGITPHISGEDFYFLLKLRKLGDVILWNTEKVYPAARYSDRVFFGTGPAMIKGKSGDWSSYPIFHTQLFDEVEQSFKAFFNLHKTDINFPMKSFLTKQFRDEKWYLKLRNNNPSITTFIKACHDKVDALRILQFLKYKQNLRNDQDEKNLIAFLNVFYTNNSPIKNISNFDFNRSSIHVLNSIRDFFVQNEEEYQKYAWYK